MLSVRTVLHTTLFLLRSALRNRAAMILVVAFVGLCTLAVGMRVISTGRPHAFQRVHALIEKITLERAAYWGGSFLSITPVPRGAKYPTLLFPSEVGFDDLSTISLNGVLLYVLPFVALLIGVGMAPEAGGGQRTLLSAPVRRGALYVAHGLALLLFIGLLLAAAWGACSLVLHTGMPYVGQSGSQMTRMFLYAALYAGALAMLGLALGTLFRRRTPALIAGLLAVILLTQVMPPLRDWAVNVYHYAHQETLREALSRGREPTDPAWMGVKAIQHTPTCALNVIFYYIYRPTAGVPNPDCRSCGALLSSARTIRGEAIALAAAMSIAFLLGGGLFVRREVSAP